MDNLIYILFVCIAIPLLLSLGMLDKKSKLIVGFIIIGAFMCMFISEVNGLIRAHSDKSLFYITTAFTPITEEIIKALPVIIYAFAYSDKRETLISVSMAIGIGFAILENAFIFVNSGASYDILWAVKRVFGASLMHGLCTSMVGIGVSYVHKRRKLFYTGTFALLVTAIIYHSIYNVLVQSNYPNWGYFMPIITYIPILLITYRERYTNPKEFFADTFKQNRK